VIAFHPEFIIFFNQPAANGFTWPESVEITGVPAVAK